MEHEKLVRNFWMIFFTCQEMLISQDQSHVQALPFYWENHHSSGRNEKHTNVHWVSPLGNMPLVGERSSWSQPERSPLRESISLKSECLHAPLLISSNKGWERQYHQPGIAQFEEHAGGFAPLLFYFLWTGLGEDGRSSQCSPSLSKPNSHPFGKKGGNGLCQLFLLPLPHTWAVGGQTAKLGDCELGLERLSLSLVSSPSWLPLATLLRYH